MQATKISQYDGHTYEKMRQQNSAFRFPQIAVITGREYLNKSTP